MTLRSRFAWAAGGAVAVAILGVALVMFSAERREVRLMVDDDLRRRAADLAAELLASGEVDEVLRPGELGGMAVYAQVVTPEGEAISLSSSRPVLPVSEETRAVAAGIRDRFFDDLEIEGVRVRALTVPLGNGALQVARPMEELDAHVLAVGGLLGLVALAGIGVTVLLGQAVAGAALRPVGRLSAAAEGIARTRDLRRRLEARGGDELSRLAASINAMLEALEESTRAQRQLVADASHELKTPLTSLRTNLEVLEEAHDLPRHERQQLLADLRAEVEDLGRAVDDLIDLARGDGDDALREEVDVAEVAAEVVEQTRSRAREVHLDADLRPLWVVAERAQLARAIGNLLDNAVKWSLPDGRIDVRLRDGRLVVRDQGPGIDPAHIERVFDRFYRAPEARSLPGAGLGLAIVRKVADAHGWSVRAVNVDGGGAQLEIRFTTDSSPTLGAFSGSFQPDRVHLGAQPQPTGEERPTVDASLVRRRSLWAIAAIIATVPLLALFGVPVLAQDGPPELRTVTGTLERCGDAYCVDGEEVGFGPRWYLESTQAPADYDGDGAVETLAVEFAGLVGVEVTLEVEVDGDVYTVNGQPYRDLDGDPPPWAAGPPRVTPDPTPQPTGSPSPEPGEAELRTVTGTLERCGDAYCVDGEEVDFGPRWYLESTQAPADYDGDGAVETLAVEFAGLVGVEVPLEVEVDGDVISVNGVAYRNAEGPPPWAGGPLGQGRSVRDLVPQNAGPPADAGPPANAGPPVDAGPPR